MRKLKPAVAAISLLGAAAFAGAADAQAYGGGSYGPTPPYAAAGRSYDTYNERCDGFTLAGARAGITVLGINLDGGAGVRLSAGERCHGGGRRHERPVAYAPAPPPPPYAEPAYAEPAYAPQGYAEPSYAPPPATYGGGYVTSYSYPTYAAPCGCGW